MKKLSIVAVLLAAATTPAQAQSISDALKDCGRQQNSLKRLVCYDKVVESLDRYTGLEDLVHVPAPLPPAAAGAAAGNAATQQGAPYKPQPRAASSAPATSGGDFGMENRRSDDAVDKIYANIQSIKKNARKRWVVTLDNGQVWYQTGNDSLSLKQGQTVYVERGALGAFYMSRDDVNRRIRVKRSK